MSALAYKTKNGCLVIKTNQKNDEGQFLYRYKNKLYCIEKLQCLELKEFKRNKKNGKRNLLRYFQRN